MDIPVESQNERFEPLVCLVPHAGICRQHEEDSVFTAIQMLGLPVLDDWMAWAKNSVGCII